MFSTFVWSFRSSRKSFQTLFRPAGAPETLFKNCFAFLHLKEVLSKVVWTFLSSRKSFQFLFGLSAAQENLFKS